jgi:hypothetical protein
MMRQQRSSISRASSSNVGSLMRSLSGGLSNASWELDSKGSSQAGSAAPGGFLARAFRRKEQDSSPTTEDSLLAAVREAPAAGRGTSSSSEIAGQSQGQDKRSAPGPLAEACEQQQQQQQQQRQPGLGRVEGEEGGGGRSWQRWLGLGRAPGLVFDASGLPLGMEWALELDAAELEEVAQVGVAWKQLRRRGRLSWPCWPASSTGCQPLH